MPKKALKVVVEVKFRAVSCPGVHLPAKHDLYLSMSFMGQGRHSDPLPAVFPLLLFEKMLFEKIFPHALDPGDIIALLEYETVRIELVQLIPPAGDVLACFEQDARRFLFPDPKLVPSFSGVDQEVLMTRAPHFPGIAPMLEFSTKTTITECSAYAEVNVYPNVLMKPVMRRNRKCPSRPRTSSPQKKQPQTPGRRRSGRIDRQSTDGSKPNAPRSQSLSPQRAGSTYRLDRLSLDPGQAERDKTIRFRPSGQTSADSSCLAASDPLDSHPGLEPSALWRSYREHARLGSSHREWAEVHERVRGLLTTPKAVRRLVSGATVSEVDQVLARKSISPGPP